MSVNEVIQIVSTLGFPIVMCGALFWYVVTSNNHARQQITNMQAQLAKLQQQQAEENRKSVEAINNNTTAVKILTERIGGKIDVAGN